MKQCNQIREIQNNLGLSSSNEDIKEAFEKKHGYKPSSQSVYASIGSERDRSLQQLNGKQFADVKKTAKNSFNNNFGKFKNAVMAVSDYLKQT